MRLMVVEIRELLSAIIDLHVGKKTFLTCRVHIVSEQGRILSYKAKHDI